VSRSFTEFTLERSEELRITNERNGLLTMRLQDAGKIATPIFLPEAVLIQVYHEIFTPSPCRDYLKKIKKFQNSVAFVCI